MSKAIELTDAELDLIIQCAVAATDFAYSERARSEIEALVARLEAEQKTRGNGVDEETEQEQLTAKPLV